MEFDKSRVFTALNADELKQGDKVIVADDMLTLKAKVSEGFNWHVVAITSILGEEWYGRFDIDKHNFPLTYLVERAKNCTNCGEGKWDAEHKKILCDPAHCGNGNVVFRNHEIEVCEYWKPKTKQKVSEICINCKYSSCSYCNINEGRFFEPYCEKHNKPVGYDGTCPDYCLKTEQKAEKHTDCNHCEEARKAYACAMTNACPNKHYRPFKDTNELIKVWMDGGKYDYKEMPHIWVRSKFNKDHKGVLINNYFGEYVELGKVQCSLSRLFDEYVFLDDSPCGAEE